eukprot:1052150-Amorphochlora_amoeboformis.AAC.2
MEVEGEAKAGVGTSRQDSATYEPREATGDATTTSALPMGPDAYLVTEPSVMRAVEQAVSLAGPSGVVRGRRMTIRGYLVDKHVYEYAMEHQLEGPGGNEKRSSVSTPVSAQTTASAQTPASESSSTPNWTQSLSASVKSSGDAPRIALGASATASVTSETSAMRGSRPLKSFSCLICLKPFRSQSELQRHKRVHTGSKRSLTYTI